MVPSRSPPLTLYSLSLQCLFDKAFFTYYIVRRKWDAMNRVVIMLKFLVYLSLYHFYVEVLCNRVGCDVVLLLHGVHTTFSEPLNCVPICNQLLLMSHINATVKIIHFYHKSSQLLMLCLLPTDIVTTVQCQEKGVCEFKLFQGYCTDFFFFFSFWVIVKCSLPIYFVI